jgi:hypothetical protein
MFLGLPDPLPDPLFKGMDPDPYRYQIVTNPQHCIKVKSSFRFYEVSALKYWFGALEKTITTFKRFFPH